jgi:hypothetical protein
VIFASSLGTVFGWYDFLHLRATPSAILPYSFLITVTLMGLGTFFTGVLPSCAQWGIMAPIVLIALRLVQSLALAGAYGWAAIYVAEQALAR